MRTTGNNEKKVHALCIGSDEQRKYEVAAMTLNESGVPGDISYGNMNRQLALTGKDVIDRISENFGLSIGYNGSLNEHIIIDRISDITVKTLDRFVCNDIELEVTHIGDTSIKDIQSATDLFLAKHAIFLRVVKPGTLKPGDTLTFLHKTYKTGIIVLSDRAARGEYKDLSGRKIEEMLGEWFEKYHLPSDIQYNLIPDDPATLSGLLSKSLFDNFDIVFTTGGTGIGPRDITVETVRPLLTKEIPGIMEMIRNKTALSKPSAVLSCGIAGIMGKTLIFTLPGNVKAVEDYMVEIFKILDHAILTIHGIDIH